MAEPMPASEAELINPGDHDPDLIRAVGDKLNQHWPNLLNDGVQYRVAVDALDGAVQYQDEQAEALANQVMVGQMGPSAEGGWGLTAHVPNEITGALVGWARGMLGDAPNYVEQSFSFTDRQEGERFAITVQRVGNLTPHDARRQAEAEVERLTAELIELQGQNTQTEVNFETYVEAAISREKELQAELATAKAVMYRAFKDGVDHEEVLFLIRRYLDVYPGATTAFPSTTEEGE